MAFWSVETINVMPLYGGLSLKEQVSAIQPAPKGHRKVVLATNIAHLNQLLQALDERLARLEKPEEKSEEEN